MSLAPGDRWLYAWAASHATAGAASVQVPLYAVALGADSFAVGAIAATASIAGVPGALAWGRLADRTGRPRPFVLASLAATTAALAALPLLATLAVVVAASLGAVVFLVEAASGLAVAVEGR